MSTKLCPLCLEYSEYIASESLNHHNCPNCKRFEITAETEDKIYFIYNNHRKTLSEKAAKNPGPDAIPIDNKFILDVINPSYKTAKVNILQLNPNEIKNFSVQSLQKNSSGFDDILNIERTNAIKQIGGWSLVCLFIYFILSWDSTSSNPMFPSELSLLMPIIFWIIALLLNVKKIIAPENYIAYPGKIAEQTAYQFIDSVCSLLKIHDFSTNIHHAYSTLHPSVISTISLNKFKDSWKAHFEDILKSYCALGANELKYEVASLEYASTEIIEESASIIIGVKLTPFFEGGSNQRWFEPELYGYKLSLTRCGSFWYVVSAIPSSNITTLQIMIPTDWASL